MQDTSNKSKMKFVLLLAITSCSTALLLTRQSVLFEKVSEVTVSRSSWKATLIIDLKPYQNMLDTSLEYLTDIAQVTYDTILNHGDPSRPKFTRTFSTLNEQLNHLKITRQRLEDMFDGFKAFRRRKKRAIIPGVSKLFSWAFGFVDEDQLSDIRKAIRGMADNQMRMKHIVKEGLTFLNMTRVQVIENRKKINSLNQDIGEIYEALEMISNKSRQGIEEVQQFLNIYIRLQSINDNARTLMADIQHFMDDLLTKVNVLAIGQATPSIIRPIQLKQLLRDIQKQLPKHLKLHVDANSDIWEFYKDVPCMSTFEADQIFIIMNIPLINAADSYNIFRIYNMAVPNALMYNNKKKASKRNTHMTARFDLEARSIGVNKEETKYVILNEKESQNCAQSNIAYCQFSSPIYSMNVNKYCVIALFKNKKNKISELCKTMVFPNDILPRAEHVSQGIWAISTFETIVFTISCDNGRVYKKKIKSPLDLVKLEPNCVASSDYIILPPYYEFKSSVELFAEDIISTAKIAWNNQSFDIWQPLYKIHPDFNQHWNLSILDDIPQLDMNSLMKSLDEMKPITLKESGTFNIWMLITGSIIALILIILTYIGVKRRYCKARDTESIVANLSSRRVNVPLMPVGNEHQSEGSPNAEVTVRDEQVAEPSFKLYGAA